MNIVLSFIRIWMAWVLPRPRLVLGLAILSAAVSFVVSAKYLDVETDQLELISQNHPLIAPTDALQRFNFGSRTVFT
ncbi:MAG: hypothetical protein ACLGPL_06755, partial [Acidobacteriota bacterium]